ncbi:MAG: hypothetical protein IPN66_02150 [Candidatus Competibacteraceae bacterium]|nr:hypothetical protein [Candidatus Competibacteraceae bacterium]
MIGRIPQEFLDQLLGRIDLVEIVNSRVPLRRAGHEFMACCPFHAEKTPSFSVSPAQAVLPLLRLRRPRQRHRLFDGLRAAGIYRCCRRTGPSGRSGPAPLQNGAATGPSIKPLLEWLAQAGALLSPTVARASRAATSGGLPAPTRPDRADRSIFGIGYAPLGGII